MRVLTLLGRVAFMTLFAVICTAGVLHMHRPTRRWAFASFCVAMNKRSPEMRALRCEVVGNATGHVLEIGPGPGGNLACYGPEVTAWTGVEPNPEFAPYVAAAAAATERKIRLVDGVAEDLVAAGVADASIDTYVATHVLCSVDDVSQVLAEASRVLKPGGKLFFLEHVLAQDSPTLAFVQQAIAPLWRIFGDGCEFRTQWYELEAAAAAGLFIDLEITFFDAPIKLVIAKPHIKGSATKP
ncbi:methyltransferase type 11 [Thecamonas trahens ATCC 50062]|uniref:Methyltransferase type 11 n=1 Tax=Thecamonas trahens ATCC 50062 TaxID=461836 RepID=A0A0L0DR23_THETB|nr:methyltransferase type 11 [Thecamonas trahens ATCC 50062]KNC54732.1 methyltransferase type 11 [Thecamonas trahens ATCC 50062]|eukprot:XP_013761632.1 methyltransferase type 11 [Thecamonas trahens ATCC 50062]